MKCNRFYSENKFVKQDVNCCNDLVTCFTGYFSTNNYTIRKPLNQVWLIVRINLKRPVSILLVFYKKLLIIRWVHHWVANQIKKHPKSVEFIHELIFVEVPYMLHVHLSILLLQASTMKNYEIDNIDFLACQVMIKTTKTVFIARLMDQVMYCYSSSV